MRLRLWFQSTGQLEALYGREGKRSWYASAAYRVYAGIADGETAKEAAALCGGYTARVRSEGTNRSRSGRGVMADNATRGETRNENDARRELVKPEEFLQDLRRGETTALLVPSMPRLAGWRACRGRPS